MGCSTFATNLIGIYTQMTRLILFIFIIILAEVYAFKGLRAMTIQWEPTSRKIATVVYWMSTVVCFGMTFYLMSQRQNFALNYKSYGLFNFTIGFFFLVFISKLIFGTFHLLNDFFSLVWSFFQAKPIDADSPSISRLNRLQFFNQLGLGITGIYAASVLYGFTKGKYGFRVCEETLEFPDLPDAFDGLRIVQISDMHLGSFNESIEDVKVGFDLINSLNADYVFFTGDLVNNFSDEAEPWIPLLAGIQAKYGKYSILGNHDYGDYALRSFPEKQAIHFQRMLQIHAEAGFKLMRNESVILQHGSEAIRLLGTENWGKGFQQYGDFDLTMKEAKTDEFKIMLSHDPTFWEEHLLGKTNVHLTLSGHTHGAQFGVEWPSLGIKFSPVSLRYKRWGGLYTEDKQHLYINRGFGFLAFPGRVGMPPEITCITLKKKY
jgi:uncharacterized protein